MTSVLLESTSPRQGSWINVPKFGATLIFTGLGERDVLRVEFWKSFQPSMAITVDRELKIPKGCRRVKVVHVHSSGGPVSVDMVR
jgi:hypothetical protein